MKRYVAALYAAREDEFNFRFKKRSNLFSFARITSLDQIHTLIAMESEYNCMDSNDMRGWMCVIVECALSDYCARAHSLHSVCVTSEFVFIFILWTFIGEHVASSSFFFYLYCNCASLHTLTVHTSIHSNKSCDILLLFSPSLALSISLSPASLFLRWMV